MPVVVQRQVRAAAVCRQGRQILVVAQRQIPMVPSVLHTIEILLLQSIDKVVYVLVVQVVLVVEKTGGSHSCSSLRKSFRPASSWTRLLHARWCATTGGCRDSEENCRGSALAVHRQVGRRPLSITSFGGYGGDGGRGFRRFLLHFSHSVLLDVECPPCRDFFEPSMANSCWSSRAPVLCCGFP